MFEFGSFSDGRGCFYLLNLLRNKEGYALLEVTEIIKKIEQGRTSPYLCKADDGDEYVLKGAGALGKGRIAEYICATLGKKFGLPIPDFDIIDVPEYLLEYEMDKYTDLGVGPAFASRYMPQLQEVDRAITKRIDSKLLRDTFLFDYWIQNEDRTLTSNGGNPNLMYSALHAQLYVLDHNLAFDDAFSFEDFSRLHVGSGAWFESQVDMFTIEEYKKRMELALCCLNPCCGNLPEEWFDCSTVKNGLLESVKERLERFRDQEFWELLL